MFILILLGLLCIGGLVFFIAALVMACTKKTGGWILATVIIGVLGLLMAMGIAGAVGMKISSVVFEDARLTQVLSSKDGLHHITVPATWKNLPELNANAAISGGDTVREEYVMVLIEEKRELATSLDGYMKATSEGMLGKLKGGTLGRIDRFPITGGHSALQRRINGQKTGHDITYLHTCVETPRHLVQILCWTQAEHESRAFALFRKVAASFTSSLVQGQPQKKGPPADRVRDLIVELIGGERAKLTVSSRLKEDLGADELDHVELVMSIEEEFQVEVSDEDAVKWKTVGDVIQWVETATKRAP